MKLMVIATTIVSRKMPKRIDRVAHHRRDYIPDVASGDILMRKGRSTVCIRPLSVGRQVRYWPAGFTLWMM